MESTRNELLECLSVHAITPPFNETMKNLVADSSFSSSSSSQSSDLDEETDQIIHIMGVVCSTRCLEPRQPIKRSGVILDLCLA